MSEQQSPTGTPDIAEAARTWNDLLYRVRRTGARVLIAEAGRPVAAIVPMPDYEQLKWYEAKEAEREQTTATEAAE